MYNLDLTTLSIEDIVEEYKLLHERHQQLKEEGEQNAQRIHELKRGLDTSLAAERYLTQELEQLNALSQVGNADSHNEGRLQQELEELRRKYKNLQLEHDSLQQDYDAKTEENSNLKNKLQSTARDLESCSTLKANSLDEESIARLNTLELENTELMQKLAEYEDAKVQNTFALAEQEKTIAILKDQLSCLEENLRAKRDELEERLQLLESAQEQLVDANAKIAMLSTAPENNDRKGNSLFAEVDDQRQVMKHLLASQKKSYLEMKKIFNESKFEIHRLKRENIAMHTELQACSTIFCSADKTYQNKLNERIRQLLLQNGKLERNLNMTQERLRELASQKSVTWLDSMLDFCKRETDELKTQLHSMHIQKATLEEQIRNMQQEMARWRFESLKSRCVLIDRENLLTEHKIPYKPVMAMEFDIKAEQLKAALPRIVSVATTTITTGVFTETAPSEVIVLDTPLKAPAEHVETDADVIVLDTPLKLKKLDETQTALIKLEVQTLDEQQMEKLEETRTAFIKLEEQNSDEQHTVKLEEIQTAHIKLEEQNSNEQHLEEQEPQFLESAEYDVLELLVAKPIKKGTPVKTRVGRIKVRSDHLLPTRKTSEEELLFATKPQSKETPDKFVQIKTEEREQQEIVPVPSKPQRKGTPVKLRGSEYSSEEGIIFRKGTPVRAKTSVLQDTSQVRSILAKKRDLFADDCQKNVQFSTKDPIVHNLSPDPCGATAPSSKENEQPAAPDIKPPKKSSNIIRRIVVAPKNSGFSLK